MNLIRSLWCVVLIAWLVSGCSGITASSDGPPPVTDARQTGPLPKDAVPRAEARSKYGNPKSYVVFGRRYYVLSSSRGYEQKVIASWYGNKFHGRRTSNGETYNMYAMSAAHKTLPLPTYVQVTNLENGRQAIVRVNDRGPFHENRILDLSYSAARKLGILSKGTGLVKIRALQPGDQPGTGQTRLAAGAGKGVLNKVGIYLQAGAFSLRENALRLKTRLASMTRHRVWIQKARTAAGNVFRVRLGPMQSVADADQLTREMLKLSMDLPRIVIE